MEQIMEYIAKLFVGNGVVIAVGAFVLGAIIKTSLDVVPNKYIPLICGLAGALVAVFAPNIFPQDGALTRAIMGLALGWAATGGYEAIRNFKSTS